MSGWSGQIRRSCKLSVQKKQTKTVPRCPFEEIFYGGRAGNSPTYPVLAEQVGDPLFEFSIRNRARDFWLFGAASLRFSDLGGYARVPVNGAPLTFAEDLVDSVAAAGVQAAAGRWGGHTVRIPVVAELLFQSWGQRVRRVTSAPLLHIGVQRRAGICTQQHIWQLDELRARFVSKHTAFNFTRQSWS